MMDRREFFRLTGLTAVAGLLGISTQVEEPVINWADCKETWENGYISLWDNRQWVSKATLREKFNVADGWPNYKVVWLEDTSIRRDDAEDRIG